MPRMSKPKVLELFAGAGGLTLGLERAGFNTIGLVEIDGDCVKTLKANRPHWNVIHTGVEDMDYSEFRGVDVISGGFPCQAFSTAGKGLGFSDERGNLFFEMMRAVRELRPKVVLAENVQGLLSHNRGQTLSKILHALKKEGYIVHSQLLNAVDFEVPQKRKRLIITAVMGSLIIPEIVGSGKPRKTIRDALKGCPQSPGASYSRAKQRIMDMVPPGGCWTALPDDVQFKYMGAAYGNSGNMGGRRGMARRMAWDEPSLTILCSPSQKQTERCHPEQTRPFTIRESARLQTFPDDWSFCGGLGSQYKQIGNAVPVLFAERIAQHVMFVYKTMIKLGMAA